MLKVININSKRVIELLAMSTTIGIQVPLTVAGRKEQDEIQDGSVNRVSLVKVSKASTLILETVKDIFLAHLEANKTEELVIDPSLHLVKTAWVTFDRFVKSYACDAKRTVVSR